MLTARGLDPVCRPVPPVGALDPRGARDRRGRGLGVRGRARVVGVRGAHGRRARQGDAQIRAQVRAALLGEVDEPAHGGPGRDRLRLAPACRRCAASRTTRRSRYAPRRRAPQRPVLVLRQSQFAFLVAASGRVLKPAAASSSLAPAAALGASDVPVSVGRTCVAGGGDRTRTRRRQRRRPCRRRPLDRAAHGSLSLSSGLGLEAAPRQPSDVR